MIWLSWESLRGRREGSFGIATVGWIPAHSRGLEGSVGGTVALRAMFESDVIVSKRSAELCDSVAADIERDRAELIGVQIAAAAVANCEEVLAAAVVWFEAVDILRRFEALGGGTSSIIVGLTGSAILCRQRSWLTVC